MSEKVELSKETLVSKKLASLEEAQEKAEEAARIIQARFPGSYTRWEDAMTLRVFSKRHKPLATITTERMQ